MTANQMIKGEYYCVKTYYRWIIQFSHLDNNMVRGFRSIQHNGKDFTESYNNPIYSHTSIRRATLDEIKLLNPNYVSRGTYIQIY